MCSGLAQLKVVLETLQSYEAYVIFTAAAHDHECGTDSRGIGYVHAEQSAKDLHHMKPSAGSRYGKALPLSV